MIFDNCIRHYCSGRFVRDSDPVVLGNAGVLDGPHPYGLSAGHVGSQEVTHVDCFGRGNRQGLQRGQKSIGVRLAAPNFVGKGQAGEIVDDFIPFQNPAQNPPPA